MVNADNPPPQVFDAGSGEVLHLVQGQQAWIEGYVRTLRTLQGTGATVIALRDNPRVPGIIADCVSQHMEHPEKCDFPASSWSRRATSRPAIMAVSAAPTATMPAPIDFSGMVELIGRRLACRSPDRVAQAPEKSMATASALIRNVPNSPLPREIKTLIKRGMGKRNRSQPPIQSGRRRGVGRLAMDHCTCSVGSLMPGASAKRAWQLATPMVAIKIAMPATFFSMLDMSGRLGGRLLVAEGWED